MPGRMVLFPRLLLVLVAGLLCATIAGCGGGAGVSTTYLSDDFQALSAGTWDVTASVATIGGSLHLNGTSESAAEVKGRERFLYKPMQATASSNAWSAGTSVGFDSTQNGIRQAIIIEQGQLVVINQSASGTKQTAVPITGWNGIKGSTITYLIKWQAGKVELYNGNTLLAGYEGALVPSTSLPARFACDLGTLTVDQVTISDSGITLFDDAFDNLNTSIWDVPVGSLVTTSDGKLLIRSTAQVPAEVISKGQFQFKKMEFTAYGDWGSDTSIGFDMTAAGGHYTIGVMNGKYRVSSPTGVSAEDIPSWASSRSANSPFKIKWSNGFSQLIVNNFLRGSYSGDYLCTGAANARFYVGTAQPGQMLIDSVLVQDFL